jgi:NADP-dependent 3-hydroxy acid dehydrogenase YdfG
MGRKPEVVVITGASAGVGRATVREFARRGAHIGLIARNTEALEHARTEVEAFGGRALVLQVDVADSEQVEAAALDVEKQLGPIDVWVNNAMVSVFSPAREMEFDEFRRVTDVTYLGYVYGTMAALRHMVPRNHGTIVQVGSALAYRSIPLQSAYCAAKHAVRGFTDSLRSELIHDRLNIHLTMVQLPALNTPQFDWVRSRLPRTAQPVPPIFQPEVAADAIYWAAHHRRREVNVGFSTVKAIWGSKVIPGILDRYLASVGYEAQQTHDRRTPHPDNLFEPLPHDHGAHGRFDNRAKSGSFQVWMTTNRALTGIAAMGTLGMLACGFAAIRKILKGRPSRVERQWLKTGISSTATPSETSLRMVSGAIRYH